MLMFTIVRVISVWVALIALGITGIAAQAGLRNQSAEDVLRQDVARLGSHGNDDFADVKRLAQAPSVAAGILVEQLDVLEHPERAIVGEADPGAEHVLSSIRALRYIVGGWDFCAPTKWKPGHAYDEGIRNYWLHFNSKGCVTFFAVWPSRDRTYIAPVDAQRRIIAAWRQWYAKKGRAYHYKPMVNPETWQWIEGVDKVVPVGDVSQAGVSHR